MRPAKAKLYLSASVVMMALGATPALAQQQNSASASTESPVATAAQGEVALQDEIIVTGVRASMMKGLEIKRESTQIVESIVAEDIGKLPDNNVIETLQRVAGIQVTDRGAGETAAISIRGLSDITTTWNGRNVFTASGRSLSLQDFPSSLISRIDVYKTRAAEQIETGIAGQVDVFTRRPFDFKDFTFSATARGTYYEQADKFNPTVSALISDRWETGIGEVGVLINASFTRTKFRDQSITAGALLPFADAKTPGQYFSPLQRIAPTMTWNPGTPSERTLDYWEPGQDYGLPATSGSMLTVRENGQVVGQIPYLLSRDAVFAVDSMGTRKRPAVNAAVQYRPNEASEYTFEFMYEGYRNANFNNLHFAFVDWWGALGSDPASSFELFPGTNIIKSRTVGSPEGFNSGDMNASKTDTFVYALNGKWDITDNFKLQADLSYQTSKFASTFLAMRTTGHPIDPNNPGSRKPIADSVTVDFNGGGGFPSWQFGPNTKIGDPASWRVGEFYDNANKNKGDAYTLSVDGDYEFDGGLLRRLSFGVRYDDRSASEASRTQSAGWLGQQFSAMDSDLFHYNKDFFDGRSNVPSSWVVANGYYLRDNADQIRRMYQSVTPSIKLSDQLALVETFRIDEVTSAAYLQADFEHDVFGRPLLVQLGGRFVHVKTDMDFTDYYTGVNSSDTAKVSDFLKSATIRYDITDEFRVRFNYGETLRRPNFVDLNPNRTLTDDLTNIGYGSGSGGNPDLEPTRAKNFDLGFEWFFENDSALYATLFRREIDGLVVRLGSKETHNIPGNKAKEYLVTQPLNASDGVLKGAEIGGVWFPTLPGLLNGLGVQGSLTLLKSSQNTPIVVGGEVVGQAKTDFFGVSDLSYNVTLAYDHGPVDARLSYVWRKAFLYDNESRQFANPIGRWRKPEKSLDFQLSYDVTDQLLLTFDAVNLTNEYQQSYYKFDTAGGPDTHSFGSALLSRTFSIGLRYSFN